MRLVTTVLAAAMLTAAMPLSATVAETSERGFVTQDQVDVAASPLDTWLALIRPAAWWNVELPLLR